MAEKYNAAGGTSQQLIDEYHAQMIDIDRQLYETGRYTGPVPNPKTGQVTEKTLNKAQAKQLKNRLWYEADTLEGYEYADRHQKNIFMKAVAAVVRAIKSLNPFYLIRRYQATKMYANAMQDIYAAEALYDASAFKPEEQKAAGGEPEKDKAGNPFKEEKDKEKTTETREKETSKEAPSKEAEPKEETRENPEEKSELTKEEKAKVYHDKFYEELSKLMEEGSLKKSEAIIQLLDKNPLNVYNIDQNDFTKDVATKALIVMSEKQEKQPGIEMLSLAKSVPAIIKADTKNPALEGLFKYLPTAIESNPETLRFISAGQISQKLVEFTLNDIRQHSGDDAEKKVEEFFDKISEYGSKASNKFMEIAGVQRKEPEVTKTEQEDVEKADEVQPEAPVAPTTPVVNDNPFLDMANQMKGQEDVEKAEEPKELHWSQMPEFAQFVQEFKADSKLVGIAPIEQVHEAAKENIIERHPALYAKLPDKEKNLSATAIAVTHDPYLILEAPENLSIEAICQAVETYAATQDASYLQLIARNAENAEHRNEESDKVIGVINHVAEQLFMQDIDLDNRDREYEDMAH